MVLPHLLFCKEQIDFNSRLTGNQIQTTTASDESKNVSR